MAYSPPLDGAVALYLIIGIFGVVVAIPAFLGVIFVETIILWRLGWGSVLRCLLTSFAMNLATTVVGIVMAFSSITDLTVDAFLQLFIISVGLEGLVMLGMKRPQHVMMEVWLVAFIANVISYILLAVGLVLVFLLGLIL